MSERFFDEAFMRQLERLTLVAKRVTAGSTQGERRSRKLGQSVEFTDYRPYVIGDDFRRIDWNAFARLERFFLKLFIEEEDTTVHFLIDTSQSMSWGTPDKTGYAARVAGALGYITMSGLDRVTVTAVGGEHRGPGQVHFPPHRGKNQANALFSFLQGLVQDSSRETELKSETYQASGNIEQQLQAYAVGAKSPGLLILISDLMDDGWMGGLRALFNRGFDITLLHILAPDEVDPEMDGDFRLINSEGSGNVEITADYESLAQYRSQLADWQESLYDFCAARQITYLPVDTSIPLETVLFTWMRRQGVLV